MQLQQLLLVSLISFMSFLSSYTSAVPLPMESDSSGESGSNLSNSYNDVELNKEEPIESGQSVDNSQDGDEDALLDGIMKELPSDKWESIKNTDKGDNTEARHKTVFGESEMIQYQMIPDSFMDKIKDDKVYIAIIRPIKGADAGSKKYTDLNRPTRLSDNAIKSLKSTFFDNATYYLASGKSGSGIIADIDTSLAINNTNIYEIDMIKGRIKTASGIGKASTEGKGVALANLYIDIGGVEYVTQLKEENLIQLFVNGRSYDISFEGANENDGFIIKKYKTDRVIYTIKKDGSEYKNVLWPEFNQETGIVRGRKFTGEFKTTREYDAGAKAASFDIMTPVMDTYEITLSGSSSNALTKLSNNKATSVLLKCLKSYPKEIRDESSTPLPEYGYNSFTLNGQNMTIHTRPMTSYEKEHQITHDRSGRLIIGTRQGGENDYLSIVNGNTSVIFRLDPDSKDALDVITNSGIFAEYQKESRFITEKINADEEPADKVYRIYPPYHLYVGRLGLLYNSRFEAAYDSESPKPISLVINGLPYQVSSTDAPNNVSYLGNVLFRSGAAKLTILNPTNEIITKYSDDAAIKSNGPSGNSKQNMMPYSKIDFPLVFKRQGINQSMEYFGGPKKGSDSIESSIDVNSNKESTSKTKTVYSNHLKQVALSKDKDVNGNTITVIDGDYKYLESSSSAPLFLTKYHHEDIYNLMKNLNNYSLDSSNESDKAPFAIFKDDQ